jgi:hypothetical protein
VSKYYIKIQGTIRRENQWRENEVRKKEMASNEGQ